MARPSFCAGALVYDAALRPTRVKCYNETGDPLTPLCASCRILEKKAKERFARETAQRCKHCGAVLTATQARDADRGARDREKKYGGGRG